MCSYAISKLWDLNIRGSRNQRDINYVNFYFATAYIELFPSKCLKSSTFIVFFDFLSTILAPYLCRHIYFYCLYNSTV